MIRINLLPAELRRGNRIAPKVLGAAFAGAVAVSAAVGWFGIVYFGDLGTAEAALQQVESKLAERTKRVTYHDSLIANRSDYTSRVETIQGIGKSRRLWTKFCDELIDAVNNNGNTERHLAWFEGITARIDKKGASVTLKRAQVQGGELTRVANFHDDLEQAPFAAGMVKTDPSGKRETSPNRIPPESITFPLTLTFEPPVDPNAKKGAAKPSARK